MNCPRCQATIGPLPNPDGIVTCPGCGSRLMTRSAAIRSQGGRKTGGASPVSSPSPRAPEAPEGELPPPSATMPPTPAMLLGIPPRRRETPPAEPAAAAVEAEAATVVVKKGGAAARQAEREAEQGAEAPVPPAAEAWTRVLRELREIRALQERILARHENGGSVTRFEGDEPEERSPLSPIRARHQKTVVLIDDDARTRDAAVAELLQADVPVRAFDGGRAGIAAIAEEKPDVIVLELGLGGEMAGRDVVNLIKSTMEWVDVPIVLWTREPVSNQKEARLIHGADEVVPKASGAPALVARVIALFRRVH